MKPIKPDVVEEGKRAVECRLQSLKIANFEQMNNTLNKTNFNLEILQDHVVPKKVTKK